MRRLPIYVLLDTSGSMRGEPIESLKVGLQTMTSSLRRDPYALETVWISVISYDLNARVLTPLTDLESFVPPELPEPVTSPTNLGEALQLLLERYQAEVKLSTSEAKGDWLPILIVMTDGAPTDVMLYKQTAAKVADKKFSRIVACAAGKRAKIEPLKLLTKDVYSLETMDVASFSSFWKWVSSTIEAKSVGVSLSDQDGGVDELPPPPPEINLVL